MTARSPSETAGEHNSGSGWANGGLYGVKRLEERNAVKAAMRTGKTAVRKTAAKA